VTSKRDTTCDDTAFNDRLSVMCMAVILGGMMKWQMTGRFVKAVGCDGRRR
jgi:hypothetical protein